MFCFNICSVFSIIIDKCEQGSWGKVDEHGCYKCAVGTYQPGESMTSCQQCPANKVTYSSGAESLDQCIRT